MSRVHPQTAGKVHAATAIPAGGGYAGRFHLAHHFDTPQQQFESGKLAMWVFLLTEVLLFGGLFCAYSVYRSNHPEVFYFAHTFLDKTLGGVNTIVLIFSSFTMAWAVRAAQLGQRRLLPVLLAITLLCGFGFLGIKSVEYHHKWKHGLLWGKNFDYAALEHGLEDHGAHEAAATLAEGPAMEAAIPGAEAGTTSGTESAAATDEAAGLRGAAEAAAAAVPPGEGADAGSGADQAATEATTLPVADQPVSAQQLMEEPQADAIRPVAEGFRAPSIRSNLEQSALSPEGLRDVVAEHAAHGTLEAIPRNVHIFFGIYFVMTGLHGLHVIAGMIVIGWLLVRSLRGDFGTRNFSAVDLGGLYWHLVDLVWIFLFPLLYLIH